jgi:hypothetical protein
MERLRFTAFDPLPSLGLDFRWEPDPGNAAGLRAVAGPGRVIWREQGAPAYDRTAIVTTYRGVFSNGRLNGKGVFVDRSGLAYRGQWLNGLMHGPGELTLPNGDVYIGGFSEGRLHGQGTYIDTSGVVYRGGFAGNLREGEGRITRHDGAVIAAVWRGGEMVAGTRRQIATAPEPSLASLRSYEDLSLGVLVDRRDPRPTGTMDQPLGYTAQNNPERMQILPDYPRMLDIWRGRGNLRVSFGEGYQIGNALRVDGVHTFIGLGPSRVEPVPIILEFENRTTAPVQIRAAYLDVADSATDQDPAIQLELERRDCVFSDIAQNSFCATDFVFQNYGWSNPVNAELNFTFGGETRFRKEIGTWEHIKEVRFDSELRQMGVDLEALTRRIVCPDSGTFGIERVDACRGEIRRDPDFGRLGAYLDLRGGWVGATVSGTLDYDWKTVKGEWRRKSSPFDGFIRIAMLPGGPEEGEGGNPVPIGHEPFMLPLDGGAYRLPLPLSATVGAGVNGRWRMELEAERSSNHDFRVVFVLADGKRVASRPIDMLYVKPRTFPEVR